MLPIFHGKPSKDPYRYMDELSQVSKINQIHNVPLDVMKMKLFPTTLWDWAKDWFLSWEKNSLVGLKWRKNLLENIIR